MPWTKQILSQGRITYTAPPEASPVKKVNYDPRPNQPKWTIEFEWLQPDNDTIPVIEALMGL